MSKISEKNKITPLYTLNLEVMSHLLAMTSEMTHKNNM